MSKYLRSGLRRDVCAVVYALGEPTGQEAKTRLEADYDERIAPKRFYGALDSLVDAGHLRKREEGLHDRYALTEGGQQALLDHGDWLADCIEEGR